MDCTMKDPLEVFPYELLDLIFDLIPFSTLALCRRVSTRWKYYLESSPKFWTQLDFSDSKCPVSEIGLRHYIDLSTRNDSKRTIDRVDINIHDSSIIHIIAASTIHELFLRCEVSYFAEILESGVSLFSQLHSLSLLTDLDPIYVIAIVNRIPSLKYLSFSLENEGHSYRCTVRQNYPKHGLHIVRPTYGLQTFALCLQSTSSVIRHLVSVMPMLNACPDLSQLRLELVCSNVFDLEDIIIDLSRLMRAFPFLPSVDLVINEKQIAGLIH